MGFMASVGVYHDGNASCWWCQKKPSFTNQHMLVQGYVSDNTNWETVDVHMSVPEESIRKATCMGDAPLE